MSRSKRRCLLTISTIAWAIWITAFTDSMVMDVSPHHILAQNAALAVAVTGTLSWVLLTAVAPTVAALRALLEASQAGCAVCRQRPSHVKSLSRTI